ncbi:hypothetical protein D3C73_1511850 [compost metagenome]
MLNPFFGSAALYFASTTLVFHVYRHKQHRLGILHLALLTALLAGFYLVNSLVHVTNVVMMGEMAVFFAVYAKVTT